MFRRSATKSVLIPVFFRAEMGGLQEHVRAQALGLRRRGFSPTVVCRPGPFADSLLADGTSVIEVEFEDLDEDVETILKRVRPDVVHAHPFKSRQLGLLVAGRVGCPFFLTFHGQHWQGDEIAEWGDRANGLIAVSAGVRDHILSSAPDMASKTIVLPNAVDPRLYSGRRMAKRRMKGFSVLVPSRFDDDKMKLIDLLIDTWRQQIDSPGADLVWLIAGQGSRLGDLREVATELAAGGDRELVSFLGWQSPSRLRKLYRAVDACVAPGRSALEAMASETPTLAVGSRGYIGPTWTTLPAGMYSNYGGVSGFEKPDGSLHADLTHLASATVRRRTTIGRASREVVEAFYDQEAVDDALAALYRIHLVPE